MLVTRDSFLRYVMRWGLPEAEGVRLRHRRSPILGRRILYVDEQRGRTPPRVGLTLTLFGHFLLFFALLATDGER